ncbi:hypothetical protein ACLMJK_008968 [Lecanora helva]
MTRIANWHLQNKIDSNSTSFKYTTLEAYYEALLRLHDRNTEYPYGTDIEEEVAKYTAYPGEYGSYKLEWEHQYYGASRFADGSSWWSEPGWEWICADPISIDGLTKYILNQLRPTSENHQPSSALAFSPPPAFDNGLQPLELLPNEMISKISTLLPSSAVLNLHRSSKTLASKIPIGQDFCRDGLISGDLIDFLWDLDPSQCDQKDKEGSWDWKELARRLNQNTILKSALGTSLANSSDHDITTAFEQSSLGETGLKDAPNGLQNRCRIFRIVKDIEKLDRIEAEEPIVDGEKQRHLGLLFA